MEAAAVVRLAEAADVDAIRRLVVDAYQHYVARIGTPPAPMLADYATIVAAGQAWIAEQDGLLIGLLVLRSHADHVLVENVAVAPYWQGRGIGGWLLRFAEQRARDLGLDELRLYTNAAMIENLAYYPRRGYRETHRERRDEYDRVFFVKELG